MVATPWARRTLRLAHRLVAVGLALGGKAGEHLSQQLDLTVSRNTLLRGLRRLPGPSLPTPTVLAFCSRFLKNDGTTAYKR
jgi:transposase